jgi:tRNA-dihydrouridine synthase B
MGCQSNSRNATTPQPGLAPGFEGLDVRAFASRLTTDPRLANSIPGFDAPFFQAGLAGYSDAAMRIVARRHGCPYCVTEALLDRTLLAGGRGFAKADLGELHNNVPGGEEDHPLCGQIMGSNPDEMARAADKMVCLNECALGAGGGFACIDVNLACPVKKIKNKARGGHWLRAPEGAIEMLQAVRDAVPEHIATSVKMRRAFDDSTEMARNFEMIFNAAYELGYAWVTVHGRTVEQQYVGASRWDLLRDIVQRYPDRPVLGSGDIWNVEDIFRMLAYTGVSAVAVARGCIGNPWIFRQARELMQGNEPRLPTIEEQRDTLADHFSLCVSVNGEKKAGYLMRKFGIRFSAHHPEAENVRQAMIKVSTMTELQEVLREHYGAVVTPAG